jgi:hypothetical protein
MSDPADGDLSATSVALTLAAAAESPDEPWAWILGALLAHATDGQALAEALVTGANLDSA